MEWISLFEITNTYDMVYKWFTVLKNEYNTDVVSYVIMPNHLHVILHFHNEDFNLNTTIANGKRFIAYEIINRLEEKENTALLHHLESLVTERERKKASCIKYLKILLMQRQLLRNVS